jgi:predicted flavoprotein YhiN
MSLRESEVIVVGGGAAGIAAARRLHEAGEACSLRDFSTAHGAYLTGLAAAEMVLATRAA